ncbi:1-acyl-sn-glycerol-3-phosphate acyltransferase [Bdellovibrio sp. qaytius]|nr:1-acyl-sn-glycerol-3-phosphate acyltransferase [Bdellovibrio sp. qaytius]
MYRNLCATYRFIKFVSIISVYLLQGTAIYLINRDPDVRRKRLIENAHRYGIRLVNAFNVQVICKNPIPHDEGSLLIGNHVGFIDILALMSIVPAVFVTSGEMRKAPGLGQITEVAGCTYVDRVNRMKIHDELKELIGVLKKGFRVVLYAESVASDGEQVLPFKKTLMMAAGLAGVPIRPFVFNYREANGGPVKFEHRDALCWHGDMSFLESIWGALQLETLVCEIEFLPLFYTKPEDHRAEIAQKLHAMVSEKYVPFVDPNKRLENSLNS